MTTRSSTHAAPAVLGTSSLIALIIVSHSINDAYAAFLAPLLPLLEAKFTLSKTLLATLPATISLSSNMLQPVMGGLVDRWGARLIMVLGLGVGALIMPLIAIAPFLILIMIILIIGGLGSAAFHPAASSLVHGLSTPSNKTKIFGFFTAAGPVGQALCPIVVLFIVRQFGMPFLPMLMVVGLALAWLLYILLPPLKAPPKRRAPLFDVKLLRGPVGGLALAGILRSMSFVTFVNAVPLWIVAQGFARDSALISSALATYSISAAIGVAIGGWLTPRVGMQRMIIGAMLLGLPFLMLGMAVPVNSISFFALMALGSGFSNMPISAMVVAAQDLSPHAVGTASGMLMGFTWGSAGVLYLAIGYLQDVWGLLPAIQLSFVMLIPAALLAWWVLRRHLSA